MTAKIDVRDLEAMVRERLLAEGKSAAEIEDALAELRSGRVPSRSYKTKRLEYKSSFSVLGIPLIHVVIGRDPETGAVGKAFGILAVGRMAFGVIPIGQLAVGVAPIGQLALGLVFALGQAGFAGYEAVGQLAVATHFALGQIAVAASAIGQFALGRHVIAQIGWGQHVWSTKVQDPEALEHFRSMFAWLLDWV